MNFDKMHLDKMHFDKMHFVKMHFIIIIIINHDVLDLGLHPEKEEILTVQTVVLIDLDGWRIGR